LPSTNEYTFRGKTGGRRQLYLFEQDPDSALPKTATRFVTKIPGNHYLAAEGPDRLVGCTLDGTVQWSADIGQYSVLAKNTGQGPLSSSYRVSNGAWELVEQREERRQKLLAQLG
jgi:hypothetical protein